MFSPSGSGFQESRDFPPKLRGKTLYFLPVPRGNFSWEQALCANKHAALSSGKCFSTHSRSGRNHLLDQQFPNNHAEQQHHGRVRGTRSHRGRVSKASTTSKATVELQPTLEEGKGMGCVAKCERSIFGVGNLV